MADDPRIRRADQPSRGSGGVRTSQSGETSSSELPTLFNIDPGDLYSPPPRTTSSPSLPHSARLTPGAVVGGRYTIMEMVGVGGMGEVYKVRDLALGRLVAFKVIRPELARDPDIIERFKQEILLSSNVTHRNVIRIYDLGEADGLKFITMEYIEGRDLRSDLLDRGRFQPADAIHIVRQVAKALEAAHAVGVIHRDLKPQNIMCEPGGRILVMDFGLARTVDDNGLTQSGNIVGTMEYMSPEQALASEIDQRSDIFSLGIIFYELLSGHSPFQAHSGIASLVLRTQQDVPPLANSDPSIPQPLSSIVCRCLERDVNLRYQSSSELIADLDAYEAGHPLAHVPVEAPSKLTAVVSEIRRSWKALTALIVVALLLTGYLYYDKLHNRSAQVQTASAGPALSLAVFPLRNVSSIPGIDWMSASLADMIATAIGQSTQLRAVSPERIRQVYADLRLSPQSIIDEPMLRRLAQFTSADTVVSGQYNRIGDQISIAITVEDLKNSRTTSFKAQSSETELPSTINTLAASIRQSLSLTSADQKAVAAQSLQPSSTSVTALRDYNEALAMTRAGRNIDAQALLSSAIDSDTRFALAYSLLAHVKDELGYEAEAAQISRRAIELADSQKLPPLARRLIQANNFRVTQQNDKAIEAYEGLARNLPGDEDLKYALGSLYIETGNYDKARAATTSLLKEDPKSIRGLWQMGVIEITSNNPQAALDPLNQALSLSIQTDNQESKALVLLAIGISYRLLNKPADALHNYEDSIAINERIGQKRGVAAALAEMAQVQASSGNSDGALASYRKALGLLREIGMNKEVGDTLMDMGSLLSDLGQSDQALQAFQEALRVQRESGDENFEALSLSNIASVYESRGDTGSALTYYQQALQLREKLGVPGFLADVLSGLGRTYAYDGQYDDALKSFVRALDLTRKANDPREGALVSRYMGLIFADEGRYGAAVKSIQDSLNALKNLGDQKARDYLSLQNELAVTLARAGSFDEAAAALEPAQAAARSLKNEALSAQILNTQGELALYRGNLSEARQFFQRALQTLGRSNDRSTAARLRLNLSRVALLQGSHKEAAAVLAPYDNNAIPLPRTLSIQISMTYAETLIHSGDYTRARQILLTDLGNTEKAGMKLQTVRIYYLMGLASKNNQEEAASFCGHALKGLDGVRTIPGSDKLLQRADLNAIYKDCSQTVVTKR
ncbi:MAG: tetratricopeptide repeat protein [Acidobacteria bacterium]|nr:tetratricopeptide repeat protein [Acidobacteriota bacterium]